MKFQRLLIVLHISLLGLLASGDGWTVLSDANRQTWYDLKLAAQTSQRPLILQMSNGNNCAFCMETWKHAVCDGLSDSHTDCVPYDGDIPYPIIPWANDNQVHLGYLRNQDGDNNGVLWNEVYYSYRDKIAARPLPIFLIFRVKPNIELDASKFLASELDLVAAFSFLSGVRVNGILPSTPVKFSEFRAVVESFFPNQHWLSLGENEVIPLDAMAVGPCKTLPGKLDMTSDQGEIWFSFQAVAGKRYNFYGYYASGDQMPQNTKYDFYGLDRFGNVASIPQKSGASEGIDVFSRGIHLIAESDGIHHLKISWTGGQATSRMSFAYHASNQCEHGDMMNPHYNGAVPGKWTMDIDAAYENAQNDGKDVIVYFTAVLWCPHCIVLENELLDTVEFKDWAEQNAYLVVIDNRRRLNANTYDGLPWGPALLMDDSTDGFLQQNGMTLQDGQDRMTRNITEILEQFVAPGVLATDAKPISYPTLIYTRNDRSVVGRRRWSRSSGEPAIEVLNTFKQFKILADDLDEETNNFRIANNLRELNADGGIVENIQIGGDDQWDWYAFEVESDSERWTFQATGADGNVTIHIYESDGEGEIGESVATMTGNLEQGVTVRYYGVGSQGTRCFVQVLSDGIGEPTAYEFAWQCQALDNEAEFGIAQINAGQGDATLTLPVNLKNYSCHATDPVVLQATLIDVETGLAVELTTAELTWSEEEQTAFGIAKDIVVSLANSELPLWNGAKSFDVALSVISGACLLGTNERVRVDVYSRPSFVGYVSELSMQLVTGVSSVVRLPIGIGLEGAMSVVGTLPEWMVVSFEDIDGQLMMVIRMLPDEATAGETEVILQLQCGDELGETLTLKYGVTDLTSVNQFGVGRDFGGYLYKTTLGKREVSGSVWLIRDGADRVLAWSSILGDGSVGLPGWDGLSGADGRLLIRQTIGNWIIQLDVTREGLLEGSIALAEETLSVSGGPMTSCAGEYAGYLALDNGATGNGLWEFTIDNSGIATGTVLLPDCELTPFQSPGLFQINGLPTVVIVAEIAAGQRFFGLCQVDLTEGLEDYRVQTPETIVCKEHPVNRLYRMIGSPTSQNGIVQDTGMLINAFYLTLAQPNGTYAVPISLEMIEDDKVFRAPGDRLFNSPTLMMQQGWLTGEITIWEGDMTGMAFAKQVTVWLGCAPLSKECMDCSWNDDPVATGFYELNGQTYLAQLHTGANQYLRPEPAQELLLPQKLYVDQEFRVMQWVLALDGMGNARLDIGDMAPLTAGNWIFAGLGALDGTCRPGTIMEVAVIGTDHQLVWKHGWNIIGFPWEMISMSMKSTEALEELTLFEVTGSSYARAETISAGRAYWVFVDDVATMPANILIELSAANQGSIPSGKWCLCSEPADYDACWLWNGRVLEPSNGGRPGWYYKR